MLPEPSLIDTFKTNPLFMLGSLMFLAVGLVLSLVGTIIRAKQLKTAQIAAVAAIVSGLSAMGLGAIDFSLRMSALEGALSFPGLDPASIAALRAFESASARYALVFGVVTGILPIITGGILIATTLKQKEQGTIE
jgi:cytochrome c biogenesis protein CcdA